MGASAAPPQRTLGGRGEQTRTLWVARHSGWPDALVGQTLIATLWVARRSGWPDSSSLSGQTLWVAHFGWLDAFGGQTLAVTLRVGQGGQTLWGTRTLRNRRFGWPQRPLGDQTVGPAGPALASWGDARRLRPAGGTSAAATIARRGPALARASARAPVWSLAPECATLEREGGGAPSGWPP